MNRRPLVVSLLLTLCLTGCEKEAAAPRETITPVPPEVVTVPPRQTEVPPPPETAHLAVDARRVEGTVTAEDYALPEEVTGFVYGEPLSKVAAFEDTVAAYFVYRDEPIDRPQDLLLVWDGTRYLFPNLPLVTSGGREMTFDWLDFDGDGAMELTAVAPGGGTNARMEQLCLFQKEGSGVTLYRMDGAESKPLTAFVNERIDAGARTLTMGGAVMPIPERMEPDTLNLWSVTQCRVTETGAEVSYGLGFQRMDWGPGLPGYVGFLDAAVEFEDGRFVLSDFRLSWKPELPETLSMAGERTDGAPAGRYVLPTDLVDLSELYGENRRARNYLLAELDDGVRLYLVWQEDDPWLLVDWNGTRALFDLVLLTPGGLLFSPYWTDVDGDGEPEIVALDSAGTGTGVSRRSLYVFELEEDGIAAYRLPDALYHDMLAGELAARVDHRALLVNDIPLFLYPPIDADSLFIWNHTSYTVESGITAEYSLEFSREDWVVPEGRGLLNTSVTYRNGTFMLSDFRLSGWG